MGKEDQDLYIIAELAYKEKYKNEQNIFPIEWYSSRNYKLKTEIIAEALKNNIKVEETKLYETKFIERIDYNLND